MQNTIQVIDLTGDDEESEHPGRGVEQQVNEVGYGRLAVAPLEIKQEVLFHVRRWLPVLRCQVSKLQCTAFQTQAPSDIFSASEDLPLIELLPSDTSEDGRSHDDDSLASDDEYSPELERDLASAQIDVRATEQDDVDSQQSNHPQAARKVATCQRLSSTEMDVALQVNTWTVCLHLYFIHPAHTQSPSAVLPRHVKWFK